MAIWLIFKNRTHVWHGCNKNYVHVYVCEYDKNYVHMSMHAHTIHDVLVQIHDANTNMIRGSEDTLWVHNNKIILVNTLIFFIYSMNL